MTQIQPYPARSTIEEFGSTLEIRVPPSGFGCVSAFILAWLSFWLFGGIMIAREMLGQFLPGYPGSLPLNGPPSTAGGTIFGLVWLGFWFLCAVLLSYFLLRTLFGHETIRVGDGLLTDEIEIFGFRRKREYSLTEVKFLGVRSQINQSSNGATTTTSLAFDYGARTVRICAGLDAAECRQIAERVGEKFPDVVR